MHDGIQQLIDAHWSNSWTDLPPEAESHIEEAFEHVTKARDIVEREA